MRLWSSKHFVPTTTSTADARISRIAAGRRARIWWRRWHHMCAVVHDQRDSRRAHLCFGRVCARLCIFRVQRTRRGRLPSSAAARTLRVFCESGQHAFPPRLVGMPATKCQAQNGPNAIVIRIDLRWLELMRSNNQVWDHKHPLTFRAR